MPLTPVSTAYTIWKERLPSKSSIAASSRTPKFLDMARTITKQALIAASSELSISRYGKNDYQASLIAASSEFPDPIWKERLQSNASIAASSRTFRPYIWKERLPSKPQSQLPPIPKALYIWKGRLPSKATVAASDIGICC
ncbi:hypothetical protein V500_08673 [Pseudogymnoascus sp. VKM F-4518 (FW-2643)]|nr:hypothetical protein V500_08673 [Pseudogymnoascus sp. VKM F-4518 (FW-2643)]